MLLIILGLALWMAIHFLKRLAPDLRAADECQGEGGASIITVPGVVPMIIGHRGEEKIDLWGPSSFMVGINNFLMLLFFYLYAAIETKVAITRCIRHLQLAVIKTWSVATFWWMVILF